MYLINWNRALFLSLSLPPYSSIFIFFSQYLYLTSLFPSYSLSLSLSLFVYPLFSTFSSAPQTVMIINVTSSHFCLHLYLPASLLLYFYLFIHNPLLLTWSILSLCTPILIPFSFPLFLFYFILAFHFRLPLYVSPYSFTELNSYYISHMKAQKRLKWVRLRRIVCVTGLTAVVMGFEVCVCNCSSNSQPKKWIFKK